MKKTVWMLRQLDGMRKATHWSPLRGLALGFGLVFAFQAQGGILGQFDLSNFTVFNTNADGTAVAADTTLTITGGNNGSGEPGTTDVVFTAPASGTVQFQYVFATLDIDPDTGAYYDESGYLIDGSYTVFQPLFSPVPLTASFDVLAGHSFGFRVATVDNIGEPGVLTLGDFRVPAAPVPEPGLGIPVAVLMGVCAFWVWRRASPAPGNRSKSAEYLIVLTIVAVPSLVAQSQYYYTSTDATGRLALSTVTNASHPAPRPQLRSTKTRLWAPEIKRNVVRPRRQRPKLFFNASATVDASTPGLVVSYAGPAQSFLGLTHLDQRNADNGNQYSIEPPSPAIAVGNGYVLEGVNNAVQVFSAAGAALLPAAISSNQLFGLSPAIDRTTGLSGPFPGDMRVFYDPGIHRWFVMQRAQDNDLFGNMLNSSHLYVAVSQTADPTALYNVYVMETTSASRPGCPCFADYPQIGADQYGIYISFDLYDTYLGYFRGSSILAISKAALGSGAALPTVQEFDIPFGIGYESSIAPAATPPGASYFLASGGVEYFVSSLSSNAFGSTDNHFALWALTNTASLGTTPALTLIESIITASPYMYPDVANQRPGPLPYGSSLVPPGNLEFLDGGFDSRILSAMYSGGRLFITFAAQAADQNGRSVVAGGYAVLSPTYRSGKLAALVLRQGNLVVNDNHVLRPAVAVNPQGRGSIVFTLVGPDYYPSAGFVPIDAFSTGTTAYVVGTGAFPEDGFSGYDGYGVARWGDYSTAVTGADGSIWMVTEYIPNAPRTEYANWGTSLIRYAQ